MITLSKIEPADLPFLYQWENDAAAWADGSNHNPLSRQDLREYIASTTGDIFRDGQLRLVLRNALADNRVVTFGCLDLFDLDPRNRRAAVGIYVAPQFRGRGWAVGALAELDGYAFHFLHLRLLYAIVSRANYASAGMFGSAGYTPSALLPHWTLEADAEVWYKLRPEDGKDE